MQRRVEQHNGRRVLVLACESCHEAPLMVLEAEAARASGEYDEVRHPPACCEAHWGEADVLE